MKRIYPSLNGELEGGERISIVIEGITDYNDLKGAEALIDAWADDTKAAKALMESEGITWEQAIDKLYEK